MTCDPTRTFKKLARNNRLANLRLHHACLQLTADELVAPRTSFFPTIRKTLNHIYLVDLFYLDAMKGGSLGHSVFGEPEPYSDMASLAEAQAALDMDLMAFVDCLDADGIAATVQHQTHHRGQVHAMLSGTRLKPPQLDEFIVGDDAPVRKTELQALGWTETDLMFPV